MNNLPQTNKKLGPMIWIVLVILALTTGACRVGASVPATAIPNPSATEDMIEELSQLATLTQQALEVLFTDTPEAVTLTTTAIPVTTTSTPQPTSTTARGVTATSSSGSIDPTADRIWFFTGGTISMIERDIESGRPHLYSFTALSGQSITITVASPDNDVTFTLERVDTGQDLVSSSSNLRDWTGTIPATGSYHLSVSTTNPDTYYFLTLEIPANIEFETGTVSDSIDGYIEVFDEFHPDVITRVRYLAFASAGQTMEIELDAPNLDGLSLCVIGQSDGEEYLNYEVRSNHFEMDLPSTQGYYIDIYSVGGASTDFTLQVEIE